MRLDPRVWLAWVVVAAAASSVTRNPLYLIVILLVIGVVGSACAAGGGSVVPISPVHFAAVVIPLTAIFNGLMVHGGETVLLTLPAVLPVVGGPVTLEAVLYGATNGLALTVLFAAVSTLNRVVPVHELVTLTPRAFSDAGVVVSIALTFLPQMSRTVQRIRQAQAIRGHRTRGLKDWMPILLPLLISGLERAMGLAEAMVARGYGAVTGRAQGWRLRFGLVLGLLVLLIGWVAQAFLPGWATAGLALMVAGGGLILGLLWGAGKMVRHTRYRRRCWHAGDTLVLAGCGVALAALLLPGPAGATLNYYPYPRVSLPGFDPLAGIGLLGLLLPVAGVRTGSGQRP